MEMQNEQECSPKEPWLSVLLTFPLPGLGQIYSRNIKRGIFIFSTHIALIVILGYVLLSPTLNQGFFWLLFIIWISFKIWYLFDAHKCARQHNTEEFEKERKSQKDSWLSVFLSNIIPGVGHFYLGRWGVGIIFLISMFVISALQKNTLRFLY